uniref:LysR substrate-binding domain-containing protein n=1 Tax=Achromobacter animicus TaxID=1389935 RepID=UPI0028AEE4FA
RGRADGALLRREPLLWMAAEGVTPPLAEPLPLLALPETCALRQYVERMLSRRGVPYAVSHVASGVAGLQLAVAAGLGVACLNESALGAGMARLHAPGLPALPSVEFRLLAARPGESQFVGLAREAIVKAMM